MQSCNALRALPHGWPVQWGGVDWGWGNDPEGGRRIQTGLKTALENEWCLYPAEEFWIFSYKQWKACKWGVTWPDVEFRNISQARVIFLSRGSEDRCDHYSTHLCQHINHPMPILVVLRWPSTCGLTIIIFIKILKLKESDKHSTKISRF